MSSATIESPVAATGQLFFVWDEPAEATPPAAATPAAAPLAAAPAAVAAERLRLTPQGRIAEPVRIGAVMIKLLKRYGISDAEIAEGVASYARKHQRGLAS